MYGVVLNPAAKFLLVAYRFAEACGPSEIAVVEFPQAWLAAAQVAKPNQSRLDLQTCSLRLCLPEARSHNWLGGHESRNRSATGSRASLP